MWTRPCGPDSWPHLQPVRKAVILVQLSSSLFWQSGQCQLNPPVRRRATIVKWCCWHFGITVGSRLPYRKSLGEERQINAQRPWKVDAEASIQWCVYAVRCTKRGQSWWEVWFGVENTQVTSPSFLSFLWVGAGREVQPDQAGLHPAGVLAPRLPETEPGSPLLLRFGSFVLFNTTSRPSHFLRSRKHISLGDRRRDTRRWRLPVVLPADWLTGLQQRTAGERMMHQWAFALSFSGLSR